MPRSFLGRLAGAGLRVLRGVLLGVGTLVQRVRAEPFSTTRRPPARPGQETAGPDDDR